MASSSRTKPLVLSGYPSPRFDQHIPKGYIYAAMAFSVFVEMIDLWIRRRAERAVAPEAA